MKKVALPSACRSTQAEDHWWDNVDPTAPTMYVLAQPSRDLTLPEGKVEVIDEEGPLTYYAKRPAHFVEKMVDAKCYIFR